MTSQLTHQLAAFNQPIIAEYRQPTAAELETLTADCAVVPLQSEHNIVAANQYYHDGLEGTDPVMYTRQSVLQRLQHIAQQLLPHYGLWVFDTYRSIATQTSLFNDFSAQVQRQHPDWDAQAVLQETLRFVSHPSDPGHFAVPLHNSGGAVDLAIYDLQTQTLVDFGTAFDEISDASATDFFEQDYQSGWGVDAAQWVMVRHHRRILFHLMKSVGFINYENEWWHFDLGDCYWSKVLGIEWVYDRVTL